jgi:Domain of unknown function (DUF4403)
MSGISEQMLLAVEAATLSKTKPQARRHIRLVRRIFFSIAMCVPLMLSGCGFSAPLPKRTAAPPTPEPPLSTLAVTLTIPAAQLAKFINNVTEYRIADLKDQPVNCGIGRCRLNLTANRSGSVYVTADNGTLSIRLPFAVKANMATPGFFSFLHAQGEGQGLATARTDLTVSPDLQLHSTTSGVVTLADGHLRVGPVVTNIAQIWNDNQESLARPVWRSIDKQVSAIPLRSRVMMLWANAFVPQHVGKAPISWLVLRPEQLRIAQPSVQGGAIGISLGLTARAHIVIQDAQPANPVTPLPQVSIMTSPSNSFSVTMPLLVPYDRAASLAMTSLTKKPPQVADMTIRFRRLQILPSGQDVVVVANLCADPNWDWFGWFASCGTVYLRGVPAFDPVHQAIRIGDLHYDVASADIMLNTIRALAGSALAHRLQSDLVFDESKEIRRLKSQMTIMLAQPQGRDLSISAQVQSFGAPSFTWTSDGFLASLSARGNVHATVNL